MASHLSFWDAKKLVMAGAKVRRVGWVDRWLLYDQFLWWLQLYNAVTKVLSTKSIVQATDLARADFLATDWTTDGPSDAQVTASIQPVTMTWTVPISASVSAPSAFTSQTFANPLNVASTCTVSAPGFDDDIYIHPLNQFLKGIDHACQGVATITSQGKVLASYNDPPKRTSVTFDVAAGATVTLTGWDAVYGQRGGTATIVFAAK